MNYLEYKKYRETEYNKVPVFYAFTQSKFKEISKGKNLISIGSGIFMDKSDIHLLENFIKKTNEKLEKLIEDDNFLIQAFCYELGNHEYCYTGNDKEILECLNLSTEDLKNERIKNLYNKARVKYNQSLDY